MVDCLQGGLRYWRRMGGAEERMVGIGGGGRGVANTRDAIVAAARREFLSKGFH